MEAVIGKLAPIVDLSRAQAEARKKGERERAAELDKQLDLVFAEKERSVGAWQGHTAEHRC